MQDPSNKHLPGLPINLPEATSPGGYELAPLGAFRGTPRLRCVPVWSPIQFASAQLVKVDLARKYLPSGAGAVFMFGVKGGYVAGIRLAESVQLFSYLSLTTHRQPRDEQPLAVGAGPDVTRLSIGLESAENLIGDLDEALAASRQ